MKLPSLSEHALFNYLLLCLSVVVRKIEKTSTTASREIISNGLPKDLNRRVRMMSSALNERRNAVAFICDPATLRTL